MMGSGGEVGHIGVRLYMPVKTYDLIKVLLKKIRIKLNFKFCRMSNVKP